MSAFSEIPKAQALVGTEIYAFREGEMWIAAWKRFDIVSQGKTEREAVDRLIKTIAHQAIADAEYGNLTSFGSAGVPGVALLERWSRSHALAHPEEAANEP